MRLRGSYLDGQRPTPRPIALWRERDELVFSDGEHTRRYPLKDVECEAGLPGLPDKLLLPDGGVIEVADRTAGRQLLGRLPLSERLLEWLHSGWHVLGLLLVLAVATAGLGYRYGLPWLAETAARHTPVAVERLMTEQTLRLLQQTRTLRPTTLPPARQRAMHALLEQAAPAGSPYRYQLTLVNAPDIGPNAFALPGGQVMMTDQLVQEARSDDELFAVLAHEAGHVEHRHGLRGVIQYGGLSLAVSLLTGDSSSILVLAPLLLADMKYSRDFEREADRFAFQRLSATGRSPCLLGSFLARLAVDVGETSPLLSSHPGTEERRQPPGGQRCPPG
ncbi:M48 family metallopeptidase [Pseudogulbenkiania sp. MAI-1]|uniref:M48 family metallopeptidase n=1 Tax=Pseudogulbenkiania sp. MAI-1 TaxID=990370 RepID=UPI00045EB457|nr:M48 family metallopeptidase [Pseudogulbenkiania sp. MAI-1]